MNSLLTVCLGSLSIFLALAAGCSQRDSSVRAGSPVLAMRVVPDSPFEVDLEIQGRPVRAHFNVQNNVAHCVQSSDPRLEGVQGQFQLVGNGVFLISLDNGAHRASQFWIFHEDGSATIREIPDRGERQKATPAARAAVQLERR